MASFEPSPPGQALSRPSAASTSTSSAADVIAGPKHVVPEHRGVGIVPQEGALFPHLSVARNIDFGLTSRSRGAMRTPRLSAAGRRERVQELLELIGLPGYADRYPAELSGGQQQRVALARALAPGPRLVLLDEPFAALDAALRSDLREEVREVLAAVQATAVLVTHDQEEALSLADHVAVMRRGQVVRVGGPVEVYQQPGDRETAAFLGDVVFLPGRLVADLSAPPSPTATTTTTTASPSSPAATYAQCALGCLAVSLRSGGAEHSAVPATAGPAKTPCQDDCLIMLRPEQIRLSDSGHPARVTAVTFFGHDALVTVRLGADGRGPSVLLRTLGHDLPQVGDTVAVDVVGASTAFSSPTDSSVAANSTTKQLAG